MGKGIFKKPNLVPKAKLQAKKQNNKKKEVDNSEFDDETDACTYFVCDPSDFFSFFESIIMHHLTCLFMRYLNHFLIFEISNII